MSTELSSQKKLWTARGFLSLWPRATLKPCGCPAFILEKEPPQEEGGSLEGRLRNDKNSRTWKLVKTRES